jgi:aspartate-semialdehyde dehydrogenase
MIPNIAIVGATGLVGRTFLKVLEERRFQFKELRLFASDRSKGKEIEFCGKKYIVESLNENSFDGIDLALFSPGKEASLRWAPEFVKSGCVVIDNSSGWRRHPKVPLIVPEVNPEEIKYHHGIIANPNCSTIQLVVALQPLHKAFGLKRVVVATYQSISGAGQKGIDQMYAEINGIPVINKVCKHQIAFNTTFHEINQMNGYSVEEDKLIFESRKIMSLPDLRITSTCVRVPTLGGHGEAVNLEFERDFNLTDIYDILVKEPGIKIIDEPQKENYPTPQISNNTDDVFIGRIRRDDTVDNGLNLWIVADNVRKGAATNAVQIAEIVVNEKLFKFDKYNF